MSNCSRSLRAAPLALAAAALIAPAPAGAQTWAFYPEIGLEETFTNNVGLTPSETRRSDFVTQITPAFRVTEAGARTKLDGFVSVPILYYARNGLSSAVLPTANLLGDLALVDRFFHIEGFIGIDQTFFDPFGARPALVNATNNRYRSETYRVSPYFSGTTRGDVDYLVRNNNIWNNLGGAPLNADNSRSTEWIAKASQLKSPLGWQADYAYQDTRFNTQSSIRTQIGRVKPSYSVDPQLRIYGIVGYEDNQYALSSSKGTTYGGGFEWRPTELAAITSSYEHRFFGSSYAFALNNRTPLTVWSLSASRDITTYPQQVGTLAPGLDVLGLVDALFSSRIPDPAERQRAVQQFISDNGLPSTLPGPLNLYAQQILLQQGASGTIGLLGARNSIFLRVFYVRTETLAGSGDTVAVPFTLGNDNRQSGLSVDWSYKIAPSLTLTTTLDAFQTKANPPRIGKTDQGSLRTRLSTSISPLTTVYAGARFQKLRSDVATDYDEIAAFVGLVHTFR